MRNDIRIIKNIMMEGEKKYYSVLLNGDYAGSIIRYNDTTEVNLNGVDYNIIHEILDIFKMIYC